VGESDLLLTMDLPGLTADDLDIELLDGYLSVRGERRRPRSARGRPSHAPSARSAASSGGCGA
jgi:HSP20 family molecular chaperone IbpA